MKHEYVNYKDNAFFSLSCFGDILKQNDFERDDCFRIIWSRNGEFNIKVDGSFYSVKKNHLFFLTPLNKINNPQNSENVVVFSFNQPFYCIQDHDHEVSCIGYLFFGSSNIQIINLSEVERRKIEILYNVLLEEFGDRDQIQGEMLKILLKRLIILSTRIAKKNLQNPQIADNKLDIIRQYNVLVEKNYKKLHKVSDYADLLNKSPKTLSNLFAQFNSKTPLQIIQERKILEAKRMLIYTDFTSKEIAFDLGFEDAAHFSRFFKKIMKISPTEFKSDKHF